MLSLLKKVFPLKSNFSEKVTIPFATNLVCFFNNVLCSFPGVLDASELSMISGNFSRSNGNTLSAIQEEVGCNSSGVKTCKENLIKKSPATKKVGASFLQKERNKEASTSVVSFLFIKVLKIMLSR